MLKENNLNQLCFFLNNFQDKLIFIFFLCLLFFLIGVKSDIQRCFGLFQEIV